MREIGISNITLFPITNDDSTGITFGTPYNVPWAVSLETENQYKESVYYGDNRVERQNKKISSVDITLEVSSNVPPLLDSKITGKTYTSGGALTEAGSSPSRHALAYEILMDDGNVRRRIIYNAMLTRDSQTNQTIEDNETPQTYTYEGSGIPTSKGYVEFTMDKAEIEAMADPQKTEYLALFNTFFTIPVLPM